MNRASNSCCGILALCLVTVAVLSRHTSADRSSYRSNDEDYPGGSHSAASIDHDDMCGNLRAQSELDIQQVGGGWNCAKGSECFMPNQLKLVWTCQFE